jgi:hypothetical protein
MGLSIGDLVGDLFEELFVCGHFDAQWIPRLLDAGTHGRIQ